MRSAGSLCGPSKTLDASQARIYGRARIGLQDPPSARSPRRRLPCFFRRAFVPPFRPRCIFGLFAWRRLPSSPDSGAAFSRAAPCPSVCELRRAGTRSLSSSSGATFAIAWTRPSTSLPESRCGGCAAGCWRCSPSPVRVGVVGKDPILPPRQWHFLPIKLQEQCDGSTERLRLPSAVGGCTSTKMDNDPDPMMMIRQIFPPRCARRPSSRLLAGPTEPARCSAVWVACVTGGGCDVATGGPPPKGAVTLTAGALPEGERIRQKTGGLLIVRKPHNQLRWPTGTAEMGSTCVGR